MSNSGSDQVLQGAVFPANPQPCARCQHHQEEPGGAVCLWCVHIVSGNPIDALAVRLNEELCGRAGAGFEAKPEEPSPGELLQVVCTECGDTIFCGACGREVPEEKTSPVTAQSCPVEGCGRAMRLVDVFGYAQKLWACVTHGTMVEETPAGVSPRPCQAAGCEGTMHADTYQDEPRWMCDRGGLVSKTVRPGAYGTGRLLGEHEEPAEVEELPGCPQCPLCASPTERGILLGSGLRKEQCIHKGCGWWVAAPVTDETP